MDTRRVVAAACGVLFAVAGVSGCGAGRGMHDGRTHATAYDGGVDGPANMMTGHAMASSEHDFLVTMIAHHREAIVAAGELERSERPELRRFGRTIVKVQARQVRRMRDWLDRWYWPAPLPAHYQPMMSDLTALEGDDLDRTFLVDMVRHHMMAVMMSRQLLRSGLTKHRQVGRLAVAMAEEQGSEIALMRRWLVEWRLAGSGAAVLPGLP